MAEINLQKRVVCAGDVHIALLKAGWSIREACDFVNGLPKADVAEVRHGRWVDKMVRDWHCSECGKKVPKQVRFDGYCYVDKLNYCPNCGADMRGC